MKYCSSKIVCKRYVGNGRVEEVEDKDVMTGRRGSKSKLVALSEDAKQDIAWM